MNNNNKNEVKENPSSNQLYEPVNYNDNEKWNCDVSQSNSTYSFNVKPEGYIDGMPAVHFGYAKITPDSDPIESNPLNIINKKR